MKLATYEGKAFIVETDMNKLLGIDIFLESEGKLGPEMLSIFENWVAFCQWTQYLIPKTEKKLLNAEQLEAPVSMPRQVFAIGLNYNKHIAEIGLARPENPDVFTKFPSSISAPITEIKLPCDTIDWEVEMVAVIGKGGRNISKETAWEHVGGLMVGQDLSDRTLQFKGTGQFSLAKSYKGFSPTGPWITTLDEVKNRDNLEISCSINGETVQSDSTSHLLLDIPVLIEKLSNIIEFFPGDLIFTGTPGGVGYGLTPKRYLIPGDILVSTIEGLGELRQTFK